MNLKSAIEIVPMAPLALAYLAAMPLKSVSLKNPAKNRISANI